MPFDASGNYTRVHDWTDDRDAGIKIQALRMDQENDDIAAAFNQVMLRSGVAALTGNLDVGQQRIVGLGNGTAANPVVQFDNDVGTGFFLNGTNRFAISTNGTRRFEVDTTGAEVVGNLDVSGTLNAGGFNLTGNLDVSGTLEVDGISTFTGQIRANGNIAIGTNTADEALHINSSGATVAAYTEYSAVTLERLRVGYGGNLAQKAVDVAAEISVNASGILNISPRGNLASSDIRMYSTDGAAFARAFTLNGTGLGLGNVNPVNALHVHRPTGNTVLHITNATGAGASNGLSVIVAASGEASIFQRENNYLRFGTNNSERVRIDSAGRVGIGVTVPAYTLDVATGSAAARFNGSNTYVDIVDSTVTGRLQAVNNALNIGTVGSDALSFLTVNTERMRINASGDVGIGVLTPLGKLHVESAVNSVNTVLSGAGSSFNFQVVAGNGAVPDSSLYSLRLERLGSINAAIDFRRGNAGSNGSLAFSTNTSERMRIDSSGNVGIGTTSPNERLHVQGGRIRSSEGFLVSAAGEIRAATANNGLAFSTAGANGICFEIGTTEYMRVASSGNVGIGTSTPGEKLVVNGNIRDSIGPIRQLIKASATSGVLTSAAANRLVRATGNVTVNNSVFQANDSVMIVNKSGGNITITQGSGLTITDTNGSTGNRTLANHGVATIWFNAANDAIIFGAGVS